MIARLNCVTDEAVRRARQGRQRPGWPLTLASVDRSPEGEKPKALNAKHESAVLSDSEGDAQPISPSITNGIEP
jgi:hypothetical protein